MRVLLTQEVPSQIKTLIKRRETSTKQMIGSRTIVINDSSCSTIENTEEGHASDQGCSLMDILCSNRMVQDSDEEEPTKVMSNFKITGKVTVDEGHPQNHL